MLADACQIDLAATVAAMLTERTTQALPEAWSGEYSLERAGTWIIERDGESPTLLVLDKTSDWPIGLVILYELQNPNGLVDLRIGYVLAEPAWGQGYATELVEGLVGWARSEESIQSLTGGVEPANPASARVLVKNGFVEVPGSGVAEGEQIYSLQLGR